MSQSPQVFLRGRIERLRERGVDFAVVCGSVRCEDVGCLVGGCDYDAVEPCETLGSVCCSDGGRRYYCDCLQLARCVAGAAGGLGEGSFVYVQLSCVVVGEISYGGSLI